MKKGFTLVELMAVLAIIVSVCLSSVLLLNTSLNKTKQENLNTIIEEIKLATDVYLSENDAEQINANSGEVVCTKLYVLQNNGLIDKKIKDPTTEEIILGTTCVYSCLHPNGYLVHEVEGYREEPYICSER